MRAKKITSINIKQYKRKREMNIGVFIFAIVFIYLIITVIMYATQDRVSIYEVREGSILNDHSYNGLVIRDETVVNAEESGYINYCQGESSKVKSGANVYVVSSKKMSYDDKAKEGAVPLSQEQQDTLRIKTQNFNENFNTQKFSSVYSLKNEIANAFLFASNQTQTSRIEEMIADSGSDVNIYRAPQDGILVLDSDGYESLTADSFQKKDFDKSSYKKVSLEDNMKVEKDKPAYKLIASEDWSVLIELDEDTAKKLSDLSYVKTRIDKDSESIWADFSIVKKGAEYYGKLDYDNSMIRYADDRFLNVELILEDERGLKIPRSSVVEQEFYVVPQEYITSGGNSSSSGVMVRGKGGTAVFQTADIYKSTKDKKVYLSPLEIKAGTVLIKPESSETMELSETKALKGVYNINKGYAVFRQVTILAESDEYYIVQEGDPYGLYNYDHIAQEGNSVRADEVVF
ncbi:HlyD family efflux transporter periplasmic adaptor subunit [Muricomes intestini]|uniref:RND related barrel-sandwich hybrid domain-containing protein n=1 Tax=Muricomes intestini TaxID=1796634 RepID=A0A4R3KJJ8_9FIRM|nr:HlyD family efflux transporter periplasmic adaptor subunit [Muricomes intestini]TCS82887.1 hypothetical protein EDD59_101299 [Muricomes intestini]